MKKVIYSLLTLVTLSILLLNNSGGAAAAGRGGRTGAPGDNAQTCAQCHTGAVGSATASLKAFNEAGNSEVTRYIGGQTYTLRLTLSSAPSGGGYGFQMLDLRKDNNNNVKGFVASQATGIQLSTVSATGRIYAEHNQRLSSNIINVKWKAPDTLTGAVTFYAVGNIVDGSGGSGPGDVVVTSTLELTRQTSSNNELAAKVQMSISPNPANEQIAINLVSDVSRNLQVRMTDIAGRIVSTQNWQINTGDNQRTFNVQNLAKGAYMVQLVDNQNVISKKIIKL